MADVETEFTVNAKRLAPHGGDHVHAKAVTPSGNELPVSVVDIRDGTYQASYSPFEQGGY